MDQTITQNGGLRIWTTAGSDPIPPTLINQYSALSIPAYWRAVNFLASNLASLPRNVTIDVPEADGADAQAEVEDHPLSELIGCRPNGYQSGWKLWSTLFFHAVHIGNGYLRIERDPQTFAPIALHNWLPEDVTPFRIMLPDSGEIQQWYWSRCLKRAFPWNDVIHLQGLGHDGQAGIDPVMLFTQTFQSGTYLLTYSTRYLSTGTVARGAIEIPAGVPQTVKDDMTAYLQSYFAGPNASRDVLILDEGAKLNNATLSAQESQIVEQFRELSKRVSQITGVPPEFLYEMAEAKYNNTLETAGGNLVRYVLRPWIEQAENELSLKLLMPDDHAAGYEIEIDADALQRGDTAAVTQSVLDTVTAGIRTRNEGRAVLGLPPDAAPESSQLRTLGDTNPTTPATPPNPAD